MACPDLTGSYSCVDELLLGSEFPLMVYQENSTDGVTTYTFVASPQTTTTFVADGSSIHTKIETGAFEGFDRETKSNCSNEVYLVAEEIITGVYRKQMRYSLDEKTNALIAEGTIAPGIKPFSLEFTCTRL